MSIAAAARGTWPRTKWRRQLCASSTMLGPRPMWRRLGTSARTCPPCYPPPGKPAISRRRKPKSAIHGICKRCSLRSRRAASASKRRRNRGQLRAVLAAQWRSRPTTPLVSGARLPVRWRMEHNTRADARVEIPVRPVRGQILLLHTRLKLAAIINHGPRYIVPRNGGLMLVGSTEEDTGFVKDNTDAGLADLRAFAAQAVPELAMLRNCKPGQGSVPQASALDQPLARLG